jgi:hypothetical protein
MRAYRSIVGGSLTIAAAICANPVLAQDAGGDARGGDRRGTAVQPYIEVNQVLSAELSPGDDVLTFTQVAAGVDTIWQGHNSGAAVSLRYERNIGYGDQLDTDTISGVARAGLSLVPNTLTFEAGGLAARTRVDGGGGTTSNPLPREDATSQIYSVFAGPNLTERVGVVDVTGVARVGYTRFETDNVVADPAGNTIDVFDDSVTYLGQLRVGVRPDEILPIGIAATAGGFQEDIGNLDQRVRDLYVRGDVTVPLTPSLALVGGIGYENVEISSRDAVRDADGNPVIGPGGRFVTDATSPRVLAFDVDGLLWDVGVMWRPSSRTSLSAAVGRRYASTIYYGNFSYAPSERSVLAIDVYDGVTGIGGVLNNALAGLSNNFQAVRNPLTGDFGGLVTGNDGAGAGAIGMLGSVRSSAFRGRGVRASYQRELGRMTAAVAAGYDRRTFIGAAGTVLEAANGLTDEIYYINAGLARELGRNSNLTGNAYVTWFDSAFDNGNVTASGASLAYDRSFTSRLIGRAAIAVDYFESDFNEQDVAFATALLGLRYNF